MKSSISPVLISGYPVFFTYSFTNSTAAGASVEMVIAFAVLAPVFEELVFRKVLVDHVLPFGEWPAILFSGITFGLFHGNLTQFFYAALLGMVLAYVYIRTGNILYSIGDFPQDPQNCQLADYL